MVIFSVNLEDYTYTYIGKSNGLANRRLEQVLGNIMNQYQE